MGKRRTILEKYQEFTKHFTKEQFIRLPYVLLCKEFNKRNKLSLTEDEYRRIYMEFNAMVQISDRFAYKFK